MGGGGGGHFAAASGGHFAAPHFVGPSGGHVAAPHFVGPSGGHVAGPHFAGASGGHVAGPHFAGASTARTFHAPVHGGFANTSAMHAAGAGFVPGAGAGFVAGGWNGWHAWGGGYWHGAFWPHCYFTPGFAWFLPILPFGYATYWWGGMPYYYWNNLYYSWSPADNGYVVTDPPPVAGSEATDSSSDGTYGGAADVYLYPRNGQSDAQTQNDRYECHSWAVNQTGFDPTRSSRQSSGSAADYRRAMIACLDARGYSAR
jgi:hypothetical protein